MSVKDRAIVSVFWNAIQQFSTQGITFIVSIILARLLEPEDFGTIALFALITGTAHILMSSGMGISLLRSKDLTNDDLSTVFWFNIIVALVLYAILYVSAPLVERFYSIEGLTQIFQVYSLIFVIQAFGVIQHVLLSKALNFKALLRIQLPSIIVSSILGILMAYMGIGVWTLVYIGLIQQTLNVIQYWTKSDYRPTFVFNRESFRKHFGFGIKMTITTFINMIFQNLYIVYIGKVFSASTLGIYNRAESLKDLPVKNLMNVLKPILIPFFSTVQDDQQLKRFYRKINSSVIFLLSPILVILIFQADPVVRILLTEKWIEVVPYLQIICLTGFLYPITEYNTNILVVKGRSDLVLKLQLYTKLLTIVIFVISLNWGIYGLLVGQVVNSVLTYFINSWYTSDLINYSGREQLTDILPYIVISAAMGFASNLIIGPNALDITNKYAQLIGFSVLFLILYSLLIKLFKPEAINVLVALVRSRIPSTKLGS